VEMLRGLGKSRAVKGDGGIPVFRQVRAVDRFPVPGRRGEPKGLHSSQIRSSSPR